MGDLDQDLRALFSNFTAWIAAMASAFIDELVRIVREEYDQFHHFIETDPPLRQRINKYCTDLGFPVPPSISAFPWSATFVSWCVKMAGADAAEFHFSTQHSQFVFVAIRDAKLGQGVFRGRRICEHAPKIGDIIHANRGGGVVDYDAAANKKSYPSHSAIVVDVKTINGKRYALTIGGNEGNSVGLKRVALDSSGVITQRDEDPYICVVETLKGEAAAVAAAPVHAAQDTIVLRRAAPGYAAVRGHLVLAAQRALIAAGHSLSVADGVFGDETLRALQAWQAAWGRPKSSAISAADWTSLVHEPAPSLFDRCLQISACFEGTGFTGAVGNFDGAGITFGIIGYTARHGELSRLIEAAEAADPGILNRSFGDLAGVLRQGLSGSPAQIVAFGDSISTGPKKYQLKPAWRSAFARFGSEPTVQRMQLERARLIYWATATEILTSFGLDEALDAALAYDCAVQNGGIKPEAERNIRARLTASHTAEDRRLIISEEVRDASKLRWREDVFARKSCLASGEGAVHGEKFDCSDWGLTGVKIQGGDLQQASAAPSVTRMAAAPAAPTASRFASRENMLLAAFNGDPAPEIFIAGQSRTLNVAPDAPDLRDRYYLPTLRDLVVQRLPPDGVEPLNQGSEGACTGFALAAVVDLLNAERRKHPKGLHLPDRVSPRMLYEMAKLHDEWPGENYAGSSLRGALKGFFHNGVCSEAEAPYVAAETDWTLTVRQAKDARSVALGSYYRLSPDATHYHAALNEVDIICASARVHDGWQSPTGGRILHSRNYIGGHAFAIVGYDETGFLVLNSWGDGWGGGGGYPPGVAHWSYEDWSENVLDAWVLRLSVPTPGAFHLVRNRTAFGVQAETLRQAVSVPAPRRDQVIGHIINIDDGYLQGKGRYPTPRESLIETADRIAHTPPAQDHYEHVMIYAHGGLNSLDDGAARAAALRDPFKRNGIYPLFLLWGTDFPNEFQDALVGALKRTEERVGAGFTDFTDKAIELMVGKIGKSVWRNIKLDAAVAFNPAQQSNGNGLDALMAMLSRFPPAAVGGPKLHLVGHSAGSILIGHLLRGIESQGSGHAFESVQLLAPACTNAFFTTTYAPLLGSANTAGVKQLDIYNLTDLRERSDNVLGTYRKSLLYLVSNAFEEQYEANLLGMQIYNGSLSALPRSARITYTAPGTASDAKSHGDFDNDLATMTSVVAHILGRPADPTKAIQATELIGY